MVSAAIGAEKYYTGANNEARRETVGEAREQDQRIRECWLGHEHLTMVANRHDFNHKVTAVVL